MKVRAAGAAWPGLILAAMLAMSAPTQAQTTAVARAAPTAATFSHTAAVPVFVTTHRYGFDLRQGADVITVRWWAPDIVEVHLLPDAHASADTLVLDPHAGFMHFAPQVRSDAAGDVLQTSPKMQVRWRQAGDRLSIRDAQGRTLLRVDDLAALREGRIDLRANASDALYGLGGYSKSNPSAAGLLRAGQWTVKAGMQGHPGAPWLWSTAGWGVLVDTLGAQVQMHDGAINWTRLSKPDTHFFVIAGAPDALFAGLRSLSGAAPLFPKWSLGFINSQWGIDQRPESVVHRRAESGQSLP